MKLTKKEKEAFRKVGAEGGKKASMGMTAERRKERAKNAAKARWAKRDNQEDGDGR